MFKELTNTRHSLNQTAYARIQSAANLPPPTVVQPIVRLKPVQPPRHTESLTCICIKNMSSIRRPVAIFKELKELALLANAPVIDPEVCDFLLVHSQPFVRDISLLPFHRVAFLSFYFVSLEHIRRTSSTLQRMTP
jgi:hypothetical protein